MDLLFEEYKKDGYAIRRGVFSSNEMLAIREATVRVRHQVENNLGACGNAKFFSSEGFARSATWCALHEPILADVRNDSRMLAIVEPLLGNTVRQLINNLHWKPPKSNFSIDFHTDHINRVRGQGDGIRGLPDCYLQTGLAVDPMTTDNGPLLVVRGSHQTPERVPPPSNVYSDGEINYESFASSGYSPSDLIELHLDPGDIVIWNADTIHASGVNRNINSSRCFYVNGYVRATDCFLGYWAWINGEPIRLPNKNIPVHVYGARTFDIF